MGRDSDIAEFGRDMRAGRKARGKRNLAHAKPDGWHQHTEYHWSRVFNGGRLDYWPSRNKWQFRGRVMTGDIDEWMQANERTS